MDIHTLARPTYLLLLRATSLCLTPTSQPQPLPLLRLRSPSCRGEPCLPQRYLLTCHGPGPVLSPTAPSNPSVSPSPLCLDAFSSCSRFQLENHAGEPSPPDTPLLLLNTQAGLCVVAPCLSPLLQDGAWPAAQCCSMSCGYFLSE